MLNTLSLHIKFTQPVRGMTRQYNQTMKHNVAQCGHPAMAMKPSKAQQIEQGNTFPPHISSQQHCANIVDNENCVSHILGHI